MRAGGSLIPPARRVRGGGFTLIEVIAALLIFSVGVLMVVRVTGALGTLMDDAGAHSGISVLASERLDSLESLGTLASGSGGDTVEVSGDDYLRSWTVTTVTAVLHRIDVSMAPLSGDGPSHSVTSYRSGTW